MVLQLLVHIMARSECLDIDSFLYSGVMIKDDMEQSTLVGIFCNSELLELNLKKTLKNQCGRPVDEV